MRRPNAHRDTAGWTVRAMESGLLRGSAWDVASNQGPAHHMAALEGRDACIAAEPLWPPRLCQELHPEIGQHSGKKQTAMGHDSVWRPGMVWGLGRPPG